MTFRYSGPRRCPLYNDIRDAQLLENDTHVLDAIRGLADTTEEMAHRLRRIVNIAEGEILPS
jgi:hypothetical protein